MKETSINNGKTTGAAVGHLPVVDAPAKALDVLSRRILFASLKHLREGRLVIEDADGVFTFGDADAELLGHMVVHRSRAYRQILMGGSIGAGESFMHGDWGSPCLVSVVQVMARNIALLNRMDRQWPLFRRLLNKILHRFNANSLSGSRKNIAAHYDLGNDFFQLFLDPQLMYSAAIYPDPSATLEQASRHKLEQVCTKLCLTPGDHLLEIGTGWGGLALHAARHYGCRVTTTTLSKQQWQHAREAVIREGLEDRITVLLQDYRELEGQYDKLVSIEMIEAVGHEYYDTYFHRCSELLKSDGLMLIQAITIPDQRYDAARSSVDFIQKYIFPGGGLPSVERMATSLRRVTDMVAVDLHDIGLDYAYTLFEWRQRFHRRMCEVQRQGFDDVFCRMWDFYLAYCEGGFRERAISTVQMVFAKPQARQLPVRG
ncbi:class I SAM-dependent methyltransferase [Pseudomaricurvus alkylphenolicus]|uniref:SAM-dependent methyltransferase n=1 Tax=Pseudomaricurvus alkylphenolicus TaxID=1306991 RepID=UPI00141F4DD4|nr:cyclopropane-fatty-acyl-phospholipid synthase family protein [Pseudomaricurvus alkylphenolicus]NIB43057.1 class I SAM-dependent methyltransferase [Pseudomaricurvus alkylphenolicus]